jgi:hypothetical protein
MPPLSGQGDQKNYLITLRRLKYPEGGYNGPILKTEEEEAEKFIHITRIVRFLRTIFTTLLLLIRAINRLFADYDKQKTKQEHSMCFTPSPKKRETQQNDQTCESC